MKRGEIATILTGHGLMQFRDNLFVARPQMGMEQGQTADSFSFKWKNLDAASEAYRKADQFQREWFLKLYGYSDEADLRATVSRRRVILDAGCGKGYKAAWMAEMAPEALVLGVDISDSVRGAAEHYAHLPNLAFIQADLGTMPFLADGACDYVYCDQVIMHTTDPEATFRELCRVTGPGGEVLTYVYRKKALPRELLDDHFRLHTHDISHDDMMEFSRQLTELGKLLEDNFGDRPLDFPAIPMLGIEAGKMSVQRFLYWNFLKCFWNPTLGHDVSTLTNFDWYSPSQARRYTKEEFLGWISSNGLGTAHFHQEEACYSGRFLKSGL